MTFLILVILAVTQVRKCAETQFSIAETILKVSAFRFSISDSFRTLSALLKQCWNVEYIWILLFNSIVEWKILWTQKILFIANSRWTATTINHLPYRIPHPSSLTVWLQGISQIAQEADLVPRTSAHPHNSLQFFSRSSELIERTESTCNKTTGSEPKFDRKWRPSASPPCRHRIHPAISKPIRNTSSGAWGWSRDFMVGCVREVCRGHEKMQWSDVVIFRNADTFLKGSELFQQCWKFQKCWHFQYCWNCAETFSINASRPKKESRECWDQKYFLTKTAFVLYFFLV